MKITKVELIQNSKPVILPAHWRPAWCEPDIVPTNKTGFSFYQVHTDEGITGIGPTNLGRTSELRPSEKSIIGLDPFAIETFWERNQRGRESFEGTCSCGGLDIALWDIMGKSTNKPISKLLGGCRTKIKAYAATLQLHSAEETIEMARTFWKQGFRAMKLRLHRQNVEEDLEVVAAVRSAVKEMILMVDGNQNNWAEHYRFWSQESALKTLKQLEKMGVAFCEDPLPNREVEGLAKLAAAVDMPIAGGEHLPHLFAVQQSLAANSYDIIQPDVVLGNFGISGLKKTALLAEVMGKTIMPHVLSGADSGLFMAAVLQALGSISNCEYLEYPIDLPILTPGTQHAILTEPLLVDAEGYVQIPQKPGLGVTLNEEWIAGFL